MRRLVFNFPVFRWRTAVLLVLQGSFMGVAGCLAGTPFSKGPYIQFPAPGKVTVLWECPSNYMATVRYGRGADHLKQSLGPLQGVRMTSFAKTTDAGPTKASPVRAFYLYKARLEGLAAGEVYSYCVEADGVKSSPRQFRTLAPGAARTQFIVYGDSRSDPVVHRALTSQFASHNPEFILHTGDLVARGEDYDLWSREFFGPAGDIIDHVPIFPVIGNHEHDGTNYLAYFDLPGNELWYSFDSGPVHVLALDFRRAKGRDDQYRFARADLLASHAPWKIVILHTPVNNLGGHASNWGHESYLPLFLKAKVDLVLAGHSHIYERLKPLAPKASLPSWAITHVTTGGGGANLHTVVTHPALVTAETTNHFMVFEATKDTLRAQAIRVDGALLDSFELRKEDGRYSPEFLAGYYPQESLDLFYEFSSELLPRLASLPGTNQTAPTMFNIAPRKKGRSPGEMEITLATVSAGAYELVNSPLYALSPPRGQTNLVWAQVQVRPGAIISTNKNGELSPPLIFQAQVRTREGQSITVGSRGRVSKTAVEAWKR